MKPSCEKLAAWITGYVDGQLGPQQSATVRAHLEACAGCRQAYETERQLKELVAKRISTVKAPASLRRRIRRKLIRQGETPGFWAAVKMLFEYRPVATGLAMALMVTLVVLPSAELLHYMQERNQAVQGGTVEQQLIGEIVCLDCEFLSQSISGSVQHSFRHRPGLKARDNSVWTFLLSNEHAELFNNPALLKRKAKISGIFFPNSRYVKVENYELL